MPKANSIYKDIPTKLKNKESFFISTKTGTIISVSFDSYTWQWCLSYA